MPADLTYCNCSYYDIPVIKINVILKQSLILSIVLSNCFANW